MGAQMRITSKTGIRRFGAVGAGAGVAASASFRVSPHTPLPLTTMGITGEMVNTGLPEPGQETVLVNHQWGNV